MLRLVSRIARSLNWSRRGWSSRSDRAFHEDLYRDGDYDPFSLAYPGYTTIRRFADLVEPYLPKEGLVLDLGCGPGEITCELAGRRPDLRFLGIDHSATAIAKADANIARRGLTNIRFERADVEAYVPSHPIDLATLFDSFHHLADPVRLVKRLGPLVRRWALVEPRGSWIGTWQKDLDFDWLAHDLDRIRGHVAYLFGEQPPPAPPPPSQTSATDDPAPGISPAVTALSPAASSGAIERRYTLEDFERFFDKDAGWTLDLRGTVAGLETYPPAAHARGDLRERFGELRYQLYRDIDEWLFKSDLDLHAKHWLIVAERGGKSRRVGLSPPAQPPGNRFAVAGPYDVRYGHYRGPREARPGERMIGSIELTNEGWHAWSSAAGGAIFTSYHWLDASGRVVEFDGERTPLPRAIAAGETCEVAIAVCAPPTRGQYRLAIDLVREGVTWFSQAGRPWLDVPFRVR
ncbi:MAG TPA: class I SAM-dependent methyltransferase [Vicinamibacterales bacterium]|nr:class I SAM-dependent methyltransferase [Vicinamibacterales bacterium]